MLENFPYTLRLLPPRAMPPLMKQFTARRRLRRSTLFPGSGQAVGSDFQEPPETPAAVVRVRAVVVDEHTAVAAIAEQGPAESPHVLRRLDPAGRFRVKLPEGLQLPVLFFGQQLDAHGLGHLHRAALGRVLLPPLPRGAV